MRRIGATVMANKRILPYGICSLYPLIEDTAPLESALEDFQSDYQVKAQTMMAGKLGILEFKQEDQALFSELENLLTRQETDMTIFYRLLASEPAVSYELLAESYYLPENHDQAFKDSVTNWLTKYANRLQQDNRSFAERRQAMNLVNPKYVFRNYLAQQAIDKADAGDFDMVNELLEVLREPYAEQEMRQQFAIKRPDWARTKVGCSMLSCSS